MGLGRATAVPRLAARGPTLAAIASMRSRLIASSLLLGLTTCACPEPVTADPQIGTLIDVLTRQNPIP